MASITGGGISLEIHSSNLEWPKSRAKNIGSYISRLFFLDCSRSLWIDAIAWDGLFVDNNYRYEYELHKFFVFLFRVKQVYCLRFRFYNFEIIKNIRKENLK